jgi:glycosyltransferase involved in cell wall biosynthesis
MVFTLDEEIHLPSCLESLRWCDEAIVIDSFSSDRTIAIARESGARVLQNRFTGFGDQRNWALANAAPRHPWVLILDADERVPPEMAEELRETLGCVPERVAAFRVARRFHFWGKWLRHSSLYPTYVVRLVRCGRVRYVNRGHAETQEVSGEIRTLRSDLIDENLKGLGAWFERQNRYSSRDAEYELEEERKCWRAVDLASTDPLARRAALKRLAARIPGRPVWFFLYSYLFRGGFLDGRNGLVFCLLKSIHQAMVALKKTEFRRLGRDR